MSGLLTFGVLLLLNCFILSKEATAEISEQTSNGVRKVSMPVACLPCNLEECPMVFNCSHGIITKDHCNCCETCLNSEGESCGGQNEELGLCQEKLFCQVTPAPVRTAMNLQDSGVCIDPLKSCRNSSALAQPTFGCNIFASIGCKCFELLACPNQLKFQYDDLSTCSNDWAELQANSKHSCLSAICDVVFQPKCPSDSELVVPPLDDDECCQKQGKCECMKHKCMESPEHCPYGQRLALTHHGNGTAGFCCDRYECLHQYNDCSTVKCPDPAIECPPDSFIPAPVIPKGFCCPIKVRCQCLPGICEPVTCEKGHHVKLVKKGDGTPGTCCDLFECVKPSANDTDSDAYCVSDGMRYLNKEIWHPHRCQRCECNHGLVFCRNLHCPIPPRDCTRVIFPEGECCSVCAGCTSEAGESYNHTEKWHPDDCTSCKCDSGKALCHSQLCAVTCDNPKKIPGQCCPFCEAPLIITAPPMCPSIELCALRCIYGLKKDDHGCFVCSCDNEEASAKELYAVSKVIHKCPSLELCPKRCAHGYETDRFACPTCVCKQCPPLHVCYKHCLFGFQTNEYGCSICKCRATSKPASNLTASELPSSLEDAPGSMNKSNSKDLSVASLFPPPPQSCRSSEGNRDSGEWWFDGCRHCHCRESIEFCSLIACPQLRCNNSQYRVGRCCPVCPSDNASITPYAEKSVCHAPGSGYHYVEGETWQLDVCTKCTCHVGHVLCQVQQCPPTPCAQSLLAAGECCPVCAEQQSLVTTSDANFNTQNNVLSNQDAEHLADKVCISDSDGVAHMHGESWKQDPCTSCKCSNGQIECFTESCPVANCRARLLHLKGQCCPLCIQLSRSNLCYFNGLTFLPLEAWKADNCTNCTCSVNGDAVCSKLHCPPCRQPVEVAGQCCPVCQDARWPESGDTSSAKGANDTQQLHLILTLVCLFLTAALIAAVVLGWLHLRRKRAYLFSSRTTASTSGSSSHSNNLESAEQSRSLLPIAAADPNATNNNNLIVKTIEGEKEA